MATGDKNLVVLVDDNRYVHTQFARAVQNMDADIELTGFSNARMAWAFLETHKPAILFLDVLMPDKDGFTLLTGLRKLPLQQSTFVVMMSSADYAQNRNVAQELSVVEFLIKPTRTREISRVLQEYSGRDNPY